MIKCHLKAILKEHNLSQKELCSIRPTTHHPQKGNPEHLVRGFIYLQRLADFVY